MIRNSSKEIKPQAKPLCTIPILGSKDFELFQKAKYIFNRDSLDRQRSVLLPDLLS